MRPLSTKVAKIGSVRATTRRALLLFLIGSVPFTAAQEKEPVDVADARLKAYVYKYIKIMGDAPARAMSASCDRSTPDAVRASLDAYEELGVEECWLNTATSEMSEIDGLLEVMAKRG